MNSTSEIIDSTYVVSLCHTSKIDFHIEQMDEVCITPKYCTPTLIAATEVCGDIIPNAQRISEFGGSNTELGASTVILPVVGSTMNNSNIAPITTQDILQKLPNALNSENMTIAYNLHISGMYDDIATNSQIVLNTRNSINSVTQDVSNILDAMDSLYTFTNEKNNEIWELKDRLTSVDNNIYHFDNSINYLNNSVSTSENAINSLRITTTALVTTSNSTENNIISLNSSVTSLNSSVTSLNSSVASLDSSIDSLNTTSTSTENSIASLNTDVDSLNSDVDSLNDTTVSLSSNITSLNTDVTFIKDNLNFINSSTDGIANSIQSNTDNIVINTSDIDSLKSTRTTMNAAVSSNTLSIDSLTTRIDDFDGIFDPIMQISQDNADNIELNTDNIATNVMNIQNNSTAITALGNELHGGSTGLNLEQEGFANTGDTVVLLRKWPTLLPKVNLILGYGSIHDVSSTANQELICGITGLVETTNTDEYQFTVNGALLEESVPTVVSLDYTVNASAAAPMGTEVILAESVETTTTVACMGLRITGNVALNNTVTVDTGGCLIVQMCIDGGVWIEIERINAFFHTIDGIVSQKNFDVLFVYPQDTHTYKFRGVLSNTYSSAATCVINGNLNIDSITEIGSGVVLSPNQTFKWTAKG